MNERTEEMKSSASVRVFNECVERRVCERLNKCICNQPRARGCVGVQVSNWERNGTTKHDKI